MTLPNEAMPRNKELRNTLGGTAEVTLTGQEDVDVPVLDPAPSTSESVPTSESMPTSESVPATDSVPNNTPLRVNSSKSVIPNSDDIYPTPKRLALEKEEGTAKVEEVPCCTYRTLELIGDAIAKVHRATVVSSNVEAAPRGSIVAVKSYDTAKWTNVQFQAVQCEVRALATLKHKNIVEFHSCKLEESSPRSTMRGRRMGYGYGNRFGCSRAAAPKKSFVIVQEYCPNGDLFENVRKFGPLPVPLAKYYCHEMCNTLAYMHARGFAHRDLKLENIVFTRDWTLKFCDFGHAVEWSDLRGIPQYFCAGSDRYRSPEVQSKARPQTTPISARCDGVDPHAPYDPRKLDVWSMAVMFFELLLGHAPVALAEPGDWYYDRITAGKWDIFWKQQVKLCRRKPGNIVERITPELRSFFERVLVPNPVDRVGVHDIMSDEFLTGGTVLDAEAVHAAMTQRCSKH